MSEYRIVATQGKSYLLVPDGVTDPKTQQAQVFDSRTGRMGRQQSLMTILAMGDWENYKGDGTELDGMLKEAGVV